MASINRGDNTGAFGCEFLRIYINNPNNLYIQKAIFQINGELEKEYIDPIFPLKVNFTGAETELLHQVNYCKLALWDEHGRRRTADGKFTFFVKENQINAPDEPDMIDDVQREQENTIHFNLDEAEFAAQFTINATPSKMSELEQDITLMTPDKIKAGRNMHVFLDEQDNVILEADVDTEIDWSEITNKPTINGKPLEGDVKIELEQVNPDWDATEGPAQILNKPYFAQVAHTGYYQDIIGTPTIPSKTSQLENDVNFITRGVDNLKNYYTKNQTEQLLQDGTYIQPIIDKINDVQIQEQQDVLIINSKLDTKVDNIVFEQQINDKAPLAYVDRELNNKLNKVDLGQGKLTIQVNGNELSVFSANSTVDKTIDLTIPEKVSDLNNDLNFVKAEDINLTNLINRDEYEADKQTFAKHDEIGKGTFTIKTNNKSIGTFNANSSLNKSINIEVPTKLSEMEKDIDMLTSEDLTNINKQLADVQTVVSTVPPQIIFLQEQIDDKVDKEPGKQLMDKSEIERLSQLKDYDDTEVRALIQENKNNVNALSSKLDNKVDVVIGKGLSTNDYTDEDKTSLTNTENLALNLDNRVITLKTDVKDVKTQMDNVTAGFNTLQTTLNAEQTAREDKDNDLQEQISALNAKSNVVDIVATQKDLEDYDISVLKDKDVICVIKDETKNDTMSYYRFDGVTFFYIGSVAESYTKVESNKTFVPKTTLINGHPLNTDITLDYTDVNALPITTVIGNGTISIQKNKQTVSTFTLNQQENKAINLEIPEKTSDLENDADFINSTYMFKYIGNVKENDNLQDQVDVLRTDISTNATSIESLKNLITGEIGGLPAVALSGSYTDLKDLPLKLSDIKKNNKFEPTSTAYVDDTFIKDLKEKTGYVTADEIQLDFAKIADIPTNISQLENDRGYVTNSAIGRGILTLQINGTDVGTWMANEKDNYTWNIPVDKDLSTTSILPVQNNTITNKINDIDSKVVHLANTETITGAKTFSGNVTLNGNTFIKTGTATTPDKADNTTKIATTAYVKSQDYCTNTDAVHKAQEETITGKKTFTGDVSFKNATGTTVIQTDNSNNLATTKFVKDQDYSVNSETVHNYGDEVIQGDKTFNDTTTFVGITNLSKFTHVPTPDLTDETNAYTDLVTNVEFVQNIETTLNTKIDTNVETLTNTINTNNNNCIHKTGNETLGGVKTFSSNPIITGTGININNSNDVVIQKQGTNFIRKATAGQVVIAGTTNTIYLRPNGDTNQTGQLSIDKDGTVTGTKFVGALTGNVTGNVTGSSGSCTGNAATATKATSDGSGNNIVNTYATKTALNSYVTLSAYNAKVKELTDLITSLTTRLEALEGNNG